MLIVILLIISLIVSTIYTKMDAGRGYPKMYYIKYYLITFLSLCFLELILVYFPLTVIASCCGTINSQYIENEYNIYGLQFDKQLESYSKGTFILGCGGFSSGTNTTNTYYFFSDSEYGKKLEALNNNRLDVYIKESDDEVPNLKTIWNNNSFNDFWKWFLWIDRSITIEKGKIITVPTDTIKIDYNVDINK